MVCFFWCICFLTRFFRSNDEPRIKWTILLFYFASTILYTNHWLYFSDIKTHIGAWLYLIANLSVYPIYYMYLHALTRTRMSWDNYALFTPTILFAVLFPINLHYKWISTDTLLFLARICFAVQVVWVWICGFRLLRSTQQRLDNIYADNRSYLLRPTHSLLIFIGVTAMASMLLNILGRDTFDGSLLVCIPAVLMSVLLFSLGYVAAHTAIPQETVEPEAASDDEEKARSATTEETDELMYKIGTILREQKLFTNPNLTIQDLAIAVGSNRTYVSACINRRTNFSFSQLVAQYRVENAKSILSDPQYCTDHDAVSSAIALSGFTSDQTFYRIFKELTGQTPLQYRRQNTPKM